MKKTIEILGHARGWQEIFVIGKPDVGLAGQRSVVEPVSRRLVGIVGIGFEHQRLIRLEQLRVAHENEIAFGGFESSLDRELWESAYPKAI